MYENIENTKLRDILKLNISWYIFIDIYNQPWVFIQALKEKKEVLKIIIQLSQR